MMNSVTTGSSEVTTCRIMAPDDANIVGNVHGGTIMKMIELAGYVAAMRHLNSQQHHNKPPKVAITYRLEHMDFLQPMRIGDLAKLQAHVIFTVESNLLVEVIVKAENLQKGIVNLSNRAYIWYVALEEEVENKEPSIMQRWKKKSISVPPVEGLPEERKHRFMQQYKQMVRERAHLRSRLNLVSSESKEEEVKKEPGSEKFTENYGAKSANSDGKSPDISRSILTQLMLPSDCGEGNLVYGGVLMKLMDNAAGLVAFRHCRTNVVTACVDALDFVSHVNLGDIVCVDACATFASSRSLEVLVEVTCESLQFQGKKKCVRGLYTFVSLGPNGRPQPLPSVHPVTPKEIQEYKEGEKRYGARRAARMKAKKQKTNT